MILEEYLNLKIFFPPFLEVTLLLFFIFNPFFALFTAILSFWLRRSETGGHKKILNIIIIFSLLFLAYDLLLFLGQRQQTESSPSPIQITLPDVSVPEKIL